MSELNYLTAKQVAERYGLSVWTVYHWSSCGRIPTVRGLGKLLRFDERALDQWLKNGGTMQVEDNNNITEGGKDEKRT